MTRAADVVHAIRATGVRSLARQWGRLPLELEATRLLEGLPRMEVVDLTGPVSFTAHLAPPQDRHGWSLGAGEQLIIEALILARSMRRAFEIGTFNGGTTRVIAEALPGDGVVTTLDLPPAQFDRTQYPAGFGGSDVGMAYKDSDSSHKVEQLLADSLSFDAGCRAGTYDLVLVDGAHDYEHGMADTRTALQLVARGGVILWDDFAPYWHGLVRGIVKAMRGRELCRVAGTSLGAYIAP